MELASDEPGVLRILDDLDQLSVWTESAESQAVLDEQLAVLVGHLITVPMTLADLRGTVHLCNTRAPREARRIRTQSHRAAHVGDELLRLHQRYHRVVALRGEFRRMAVLQAADIARELDDRGLHAKADSEERQTRHAGVANGFHHTIHSTHAESTRHEQPVVRPEDLGRAIGRGEVVAREPLDVHADVVRDAALNK